LQSAVRSRTSDEETIEETALAYFSHCTFCGVDHWMSYDEDLSGRYMFCRSCGRKWSITYTLGTVWFLRTHDAQQEKKYTSSWIVQRGDRSLEGMRPYLLLEADCSKSGRHKVVEQGLDRFVWKVQTLLEYFDRYDGLIRGHSCERVKLVFACARMRARKDKDATSGPGLSVKQVAAVTNLPEHEVANCTQRLVNKGSISYEVRPEKGLTGIEAVIVGFLGEPLYQMNGYNAENTIRELIR